MMPFLIIVAARPDSLYLIILYDARCLMPRYADAAA